MSKTLHIFPVYGTWKPTEEVLILQTLPGQTITQAHIEQFEEADEPPLLHRDVVFAAIARPLFRAGWQDIQVYAEPYTERYCAKCWDMTYWIQADGYDWCEVCNTMYTDQWEL